MTTPNWEFELLEDEATADFETPRGARTPAGPWETDTSDFELIRLAEYTLRATAR